MANKPKFETKQHMKQGLLVLEEEHITLSGTHSIVAMEVIVHVHILGHNALISGVAHNHCTSESPFKWASSYNESTWTEFNPRIL